MFLFQLANKTYSALYTATTVIGMENNANTHFKLLSFLKSILLVDKLETNPQVCDIKGPPLVGSGY